MPSKSLTRRLFALFLIQKKPLQNLLLSIPIESSMNLESTPFNPSDVLAKTAAQLLKLACAISDNLMRMQDMAEDQDLLMT